MRREAKVQAFKDLIFRPEDLVYQDQKVRRFITPDEIKFVASRITTSILNNSGNTDKISYDVFLVKWRDDYITFTNRKPSKFKLGRIVQVLIQCGMIQKQDRRKATPMYSMGEKNPYIDPNYAYTTTKKKTTSKPAQAESPTLSLSEQKKHLEMEIAKGMTGMQSFIRGGHK